MDGDAVSAPRIAGFGFRSRTSTAALRDALTRAGGTQALIGLATAQAKAQHPAFLALAAELNLPALAIAPQDLARQSIISYSSQVETLYGTGSVAEAAALAALGQARLLGPRSVSGDNTATAALAERIAE